MRVWVLTWSCMVGCVLGFGSEWSYEGATITLAHLNISYSDPTTGSPQSDSVVGNFGSGAVGVASGLLVVGHTQDGGGADPRTDRHGCRLPWAVAPPSEPWVALVARGECADRDKIANAQAMNASAIMLYAKDEEDHLQKIALSTFPMSGVGVVVFLGQQKGELLARLAENGTKIFVAVTRGQDVKYKVTNINRTSVLFVSVSFIILMVISLAWLIFYYIQRFRYIHAKDRLARHLCNAAKKALSKIPVKNLKSGDKEVMAENECCAVCIEPYQVSETVRTLPCKHEFHKSCVDPWLLEHRTCPMCKMDILKFYGYVLSGSEESVVPVEVLEDTSRVEVDNLAAMTPPASASRLPQLSQVMVISTGEVARIDIACDGWPDTPVPDTPISPVHQPPSPASSLGLGSGRSRDTLASSITSPPPSSTDNAHHTRQGGEGPLQDCDCHVPGRRDLEIASVCSDDFSDALVFQALSDVDIEGASTSGARQETSQDNSAINFQYVLPYQVDAPGTSSGTSLEGLEQVTAPSSPVVANCRRTAMSSGVQRSSRSRSASRKRSTSRVRRRESPAPSGVRARTHSGSSRPSSHIVSTSHA